VLRGHYNGHPVGNRLHFELQDVLATETTLFNALDAGGGVLQEYCASMSLVWQLPAVTTRKVLPELGVLTSWTPTHNGGTINARVGAMQDAIVLSLRTGLGGRARRGRMYLMTITQADQGAATDGIWLIGGGALNRAANVANKIMALYGPGGSGAGFYRWTVFSKRYEFSTLITNVIVNTAIGTVRRRSIIDVGH